MIRSGWSSLRRLTLERLVPSRRARSGEELRAAESETRPLPLSRRGQSRPFLPHYESTGSSCLYLQTAELWKKEFNQSAPSVFSPSHNGKRGKTVTSSHHQSSVRVFTQSFSVSSVSSSNNMLVHPVWVTTLFLHCPDSGSDSPFNYKLCHLMWPHMLETICFHQPVKRNTK